MGELKRLIFNRRYRRIILLFVSFVQQFWWMGKRKRFMKAENIDQKYREMYRRQAVKFADTSIEMGGLLIKLGQFFSSRVDILPQEYTDELTRLQDSVEPERTELIIERIEKELGKTNEVFAEFSQEPLAAASLGQVYRARLAGGEDVAVKVLRPGIEDIIAIDLEALKLITTMGKRYRKISNMVDLDEVYREFNETVTDELDYLKEGQNADHFRENFKDDQRVYIPEIYWNLTTSKVLTMEFIEGEKITDFNSLEAMGIDREYLAEILWSSYLEQVLVDGFFHADPHPGNLLVRKDGVLVYLDFGMVGYVDNNMKESIIDLAMAIYKKDAGAVVNGFDRMGFLRANADRGTLLKTLKYMLANLFGDKADLKNMDLMDLLEDLRELVYSQPFQIPARTTFLGKALGTNYGIAVGLDENFDFIKVSKPYIEQLVENDGKLSKSEIVIDQIKNTLKDVITVPEKINRLVDGLESGDLRLYPARSFERKMMDHQTFLTNKIVCAILATGLLISGTQLLETNYKQIGVAFLIFSGFFALNLLRKKKGFKVMKARSNKKMATGFKKPKMHQ